MAISIITKARTYWGRWHLGEIVYDDTPGPLELGPGEYDAADLRLNGAIIDWPATDARQAEDRDLAYLGTRPRADITEGEGAGAQVLAPADIAALLEWTPPELDPAQALELWGARQDAQAALGAPSYGTLRLALAPGGALSHVLQGDTWAKWRAYLYGVLGESLTLEEFATFFKLTGRVAPATPVRESWAVAGRRSGKSFSHAVAAVYLATRAYTLSPGERGLVAIIARDRRQARTLHGYCAGILRDSPELAPLIERQTDEVIELRNGVVLEVMTASHRGIRSYSMVACLCDEAAFWMDSTDYRNPIGEVIAAIRPSLVTLDGYLLVTTSPYSRDGLVGSTVAANYANPDSDVVVLRAPTHVLNTQVSAATIERAFRRDPVAARAEWLGEFRELVTGFVPEGLADHAIDVGVLERQPDRRAHYVAFLDPSGGVVDSMTMAIAHRHGDLAVLDFAIEVTPPFSPRAVAARFAEVLRRYDVSDVISDRVGGGWLAEAFEEQGVMVKAEAEAKSILYARFLPLLSSGQVRLLDDPTLRTQIIGLERRPGQAGRDIIDHAPGQHDDVINSVAGAIVCAMGEHAAEFLF